MTTLNWSIPNSETNAKCSAYKVFLGILVNLIRKNGHTPGYYKRLKSMLEVQDPKRKTQKQTSKRMLHEWDSEKQNPNTKKMTACLVT